MQFAKNVVRLLLRLHALGFLTFLMFRIKNTCCIFTLRDTPQNIRPKWCQHMLIFHPILGIFIFFLDYRAEVMNTISPNDAN